MDLMDLYNGFGVMMCPVFHHVLADLPTSHKKSVVWVLPTRRGSSLQRSECPFSSLVGAGMAPAELVQLRTNHWPSVYMPQKQQVVKKDKWFSSLNSYEDDQHGCWFCKFKAKEVELVSWSQPLDVRVRVVADLVHTHNSYHLQKQHQQPFQVATQ